MIYYFGRRIFSSKTELISELNQKTVLAVDTESSPDGLLGMALAWSPQDAVFLTPDEPECAALLQHRPLVFHNCLYDVPILESRYNITVNILYDTMLAAQSCGYHPALGDLSMDFNFNHRYITDLLYDRSGIKMKKDVPAKTKKGTRRVDVTLSDTPLEDVAKICCGHAQATYKIWETLRDKVPESYKLDMELIPLMMRMHTGGIRVDAGLARERHKRLSSEIEYLRMLCDGMGFNPASPKQIGLALSHAGFMTYFTRTGQMVTDEEALRPLMNETPIAPLVLRYREKSKLCSTYIVPLINVERVYPRYHIVRTGRFASSPNIQNIPKDQRDLYLSDEGDFLIDLDMHQIEPRIMAWESGDEKMWNDILTKDIYQAMAARYHISRQAAKHTFMAGAFGGSVEELVDISHKEGHPMSHGEASLLLSNIFKDYPRFARWRENIKREAASRGYVTSLLGRKRTVADLAEGEEDGYDPLMKVISTITQGFGADILKMAMKRLESYKISLTCHDEIVISTDTDIDVSVLDGLCEMPVLWKKKTGRSWGEVN